MEEQNNQPEMATEQETSTGFSFVSEEEVAAAMQPQQTMKEPVEQEYQQDEQESYVEPQDAQPEVQQTYADEDLEGAVFNFLSERLGREISSFDDLQMQQMQEQREMDARIAAIADFVENTGRDPRDWFIYQQLNPSEMDDMTAIQVQMASDYPNLSQEEISLLVSSKYKLDPDEFSENEVRLSQLQMKIDAENARRGIDELRSQYEAPEMSRESESIVDDRWISKMHSELDSLEGIEFDLGNGKSFTFGMDERYKGQLADKNARLDEFFDPYVNEDGSWDYDKLNMHRALIDNADSIIQSAYRQGMSDGQRGVVQKAANSTPSSPNQGRTMNEPDQLSQQLREAMMGNSTLTFKL